MPKRIRSRKSPRRSSKKSPRRSSKRSPRRSSKKSPKRVSRKMSRKMSRRATPCGRVASNVCESQMDSRGLRRCRINIKSRRCETLPMKFRTAATMGLKKDAPKPIGRLSPAQLAPFQKAPVRKMKKD